MPQAKIGVIGGTGLYDILAKVVAIGEYEWKGIFLGILLEPLPKG